MINHRFDDFAMKNFTTTWKASTNHMTHPCDYICN